MGQLKLQGSLIGGPPGVCDTSFPESSFLVNLGFGDCSSKLFGVAAGVLTRQVASPSSFIALQGVGPTDTVPVANFLYAKSNSRMLLEITFQPPSGGPFVSVVPLQGPLVLETPDDTGIVGLRIQGSGLVEYLVTGLGT